MRTKQKTLSVGVLMDMMGCLNKTPEQELEDHKKDFAELLRPAKCKFYRMTSSGDIKPGTHAVVFDYGGMCGMGSDGLVGSESRSLLRWAQDNPSSLLIVATAFTYSHTIRYELDELGLNLPNVVCRASIDEDPIPFWFRAQSAPVPAMKPDPYEGPKNLHPIAGLTPVVRNVKLPARRFFRPLPGFAGRLKKEIGQCWHVYDVGAGEGHVAKTLSDAGVKDIVAIDANAREGSVFDIKYADATDFRFGSSAVVLLCRPCHGAFCQAVVQNALFHRAETVVYVGLDKNVDNDLGDYRRHFVSDMEHVGEDGERMWVWKPEWNRSME